MEQKMKGRNEIKKKKRRETQTFYLVSMLTANNN